ncbi:MAG TPA: hypothetical protein VK915_03840 [Gaiellaceae bacterium]|nr:hypothetical protein [Gaiellaceae bacterium]
MTNGPSTRPAKHYAGHDHPAKAEDGGGVKHRARAGLPQRWAVPVEDGSNLTLTDKRGVGGIIVLVAEDGSLWTFDHRAGYAVPFEES